MTRPSGDSLAALDRLAANAAARADLLAERDRLIVEAKRAGAPVVHIADAVGLSRQQVHNVLNDNG